MEKTMGENRSIGKIQRFVYPGSEIYGGLANTWINGNLGVGIKE